MAAADENAGLPASSRCSADERPIGDDELASLFAPLAAFPLIVLAVSGGADSMALMLLARRWYASLPNAPQIIVATVDHGLRRESFDEARWVARQAEGLGVGAAVLKWEGEKPATGIQDAARSARYRLLAEFARRTSSSARSAIVTAHTADDQAETLLMRLARGSGIDGLAAMQTERLADDALPPVAIVRPLLGVTGARLRATLGEAGRTWIEDPSNDAQRFERVRVRKARGLLEGLGLSNGKLALSARRLARAKAALDAATEALGRNAAVDLHDGIFASFDEVVWRAAPEEFRLRLLGRLIRSFGGLSEPLSLSQVEDLIERMSEAGFEGATLGGCVISRHGRSIRVEREGGRHELPTLVLLPGGSGVWDHRFRVTSAAHSSGAVEVRALGPEAYARLRRQLAKEPGLPASAAATMPAFWRADELLFVPAIANLPAAGALWDEARGLYSAEFLG